MQQQFVTLPAFLHIPQIGEREKKWKYSKTELAKLFFYFLFDLVTTKATYWIAVIFLLSVSLFDPYLGREKKSEKEGKNRKKETDNTEEVLQLPDFCIFFVLN